MNITKTNNHIDIELIKDYTTTSGSFYDNFKSSDCVPVIVLDYKTIKDSDIESSYELIWDIEAVSSVQVSDTVERVTYTCSLDIEKDGWFTLYGLIIPTKEWLQNNLSLATLEYSNIFFTDNQEIYKYVEDKGKKLSNLANLLEPNFKNATFFKEKSEQVSAWNLKNCYINLCKQIFNNRAFSPCWSRNSVDSELVYKRDLAWMAINIIKYLSKCGQLIEAQRIIQNISGCNGLCSDSSNTSSSKGCGCSG